MSTSLRLDELTREEVRELAPRATVLLPTASTEQHGPHLPLVTDSLLGETITFMAAERAAASVPIVVAPTVRFGNSHHHLFACALSLRSSTYLSVLNDLADCLVEAGFKRIFLVNAHGGNDDGNRLLARDLVLRHEVAIAACSYWQVGEAAAKAAGASQFTAFPGHAGGFETSMMMAVAPSLVREDRMPQLDPDPPALSRRVIARGLLVQKSDEWRRTGGYSDAPTKASAETGRAMAEAIAQAVGDAIVAFHRAAYEA